MKYHYQYVSGTSVRIELIPEDPKESRLIQGFDQTTADQVKLEALFQQALQQYKNGATLQKTSFMQFPKVALCSFSMISNEQLSASSPLNIDRSSRSGRMHR